MEEIKTETVAVISGGHSAERAISIQGGGAIVDALRASSHVGKVLHLDFANDPVTFVGQIKNVDVAFPILHGIGGEDGQIQAVLEYLRIPYAGSGVQASAIAMDKAVTKMIWQQNGLKTPPFKCFSLSCEESVFAALQAILDWSREAFPLIIKPLKEGSSILAFKVQSEAEIHEALLQQVLGCQGLETQKLTRKLTVDVLVERWIEGDEYTVGIVGDEVLPSIKIETPRLFYDYEAKYVSNETRYICPSPLDKDSDQESEIAELAWAAYSQLGCSSWGRVDVMLDEQGNFWLIEVNTLPGMSERSLVPMAARARGLSFQELVLKILATASLKQ